MIAYLKLFLDWGEKTKRLTDEEKGRLIDAMVACASGNDPEPYLIGNEAYVYPCFEVGIKRDREEYEKNCKAWAENGKKGGRPRKQPEPVATNNNQENQIGFKETKKRQEKEKRIKNKEEDIYSNKSDFEKSMDEFRAYRKEMKAPLSDLAEKKVRSALDKLAGDDEQKKIRIIDQSIANGWKGVFPLREGREGKATYKQHENAEGSLDHLLTSLDD